MNRSTRTLIVVGIAVAVASVATYLVYSTIKSRPVQQAEVVTRYAIVAAHPLAQGARVTSADVKRVPWPAANPILNGFATVEEVVGRGAVNPIAENEPLTVNNVALKEAGTGLPSTIPMGMRAISVRVNEVIGVAGFVVPGTHVDVMVVLKTDAATMARVVVSNVLVLAAGTKYGQEVEKQAQAIPSSVVTVMLTPEDAERVALAAVEGQIMLTLRNPMDTAPTISPGTRTSSLVSGVQRPESAATSPDAPQQTKSQPRPQPKPAPKRVDVAVAPAPPPPPAPPKPYAIEMIRGAKRTEEIIR